VLAKDPNNLDALGLLAASARTPDEVKAALARLEATRRAVGARPQLLISLAGLYLRSGAAPEAERLLREAVAQQPKSAQAPRARRAPSAPRRATVQAEREYKTAADIVPIGSPARIGLADFYLRSRRPDEAKRVLTEITRKAPDYLPAWRRLAEVAFSERQFD